MDPSASGTPPTVNVHIAFQPGYSGERIVLGADVGKDWTVQRVINLLSKAAYTELNTASQHPDGDLAAPFTNVRLVRTDGEALNLADRIGDVAPDDSLAPGKRELLYWSYCSLPQNRGGARLMKGKRAPSKSSNMPIMLMA